MIERLFFEYALIIVVAIMEHEKNLRKGYYASLMQIK